MKTQTKLLALFILVLYCVLPVHNAFSQDTLTPQNVPFERGNLNDIFFIGEDVGWAVGYDHINRKAAIIHTVNGGDLWELQEIDLNVMLNGIHMTDNVVGYAVGEDRSESPRKIVILKTTNGGQQWELQAVPDLSGELRDVFFTSSGQGLAVGINNTNLRTLILRTTNGVDWQQVNHSFHMGVLNAVHLSDGLHGWAVGRRIAAQWNDPPFVYKTIDGGVTWTEVITPVVNGGFLDVFFTSPDSGIVVGSSGDNGVVLRTIDGGETWDETLFLPGQIPKPTSENTLSSEQEGSLITSAFQRRKVIILTILRYVDDFFSSQVLKSGDSGKKWENFGPPISGIEWSKTYVTPEGKLFTTGTFGIGWPPIPVIGTGTVTENGEEDSKLLIDPPNAKLKVGEEQEFRARYDISDSVRVADPYWETTGGGYLSTTDSSCTYTATTPGDYTITCTDRSTGKYGTAAIQVTSTDSVHAWVDEYGVLHIKLWGNANVVVGVDENGNVLVNGQPVGDPPVKARHLRGIRVEGGDGNNIIDLRGVKREDFPNIEDGKIVLDGGPGDDEMYGSEFGDIMYGGSGDDDMHGGPGDDEMYGGDGDDNMYGGPGDDDMYGGDGDDIMNGGDGDDIMYGGPGNDIMYGGDGDDFMNGGAGNDVLISKPGSTNVLSDEAGNDTVDFSPANFGITIDLDLQDVDQVVDIEGNIIRLEGEFENFTGSDFDDVVFLYPLAVPRRIDGGGHVQGDTIYIDAKGLSVTQTDSTLTVEGYAPVTYYNYASVNIIHRVLDRIEVTPAEVTLQLEEQRQFTAAGFDGSNNNIPVTPIWSTTGGSIDSSGLYTATEIGEFTITASVDGSSINGIATVRVITTSVERIDDMPMEFALFQNYPNPFNPETIIEYSVKEACYVRLEIYNVMGGNVLTLVNSFQQPGVYRASFDAAGLSTGVYFYRIRMNDFVAVKKMVLLQ